MSFILSAVIVLGCIALVAAVILYVCSKRFAVKEDPRIAIAKTLPIITLQSGCVINERATPSMI